MSGDLGRRRELQVRDKLRADGCVAYRLPQPSAADVIALKAGTRPVLVQVKSTAQGPFERFGPIDRQALLDEARAAGTDCTLAWWPKGGELRWVTPTEWPALRRAA